MISKSSSVPDYYSKLNLLNKSKIISKPIKTTQLIHNPYAEQFVFISSLQQALQEISIEDNEEPISDTIISESEITQCK